MSISGVRGPKDRKEAVADVVVMVLSPLEEREGEGISCSPMVSAQPLPPPDYRAWSGPITLVSCVLYTANYCPLLRCPAEPWHGN